VPHAKTLTPGHVVVYPNREKASSKTMKGIVVLILLVSAGLMLIVTVGAWSKLAGLKPVNIVWILVYLILAFYVARWRRGMLPIAAALGVLLLMTAIIAGTGVSGTSWFDRSHTGFAHAQMLFGGTGLPNDLTGLLTILIAPVQILLIVFAMLAFAQGWHVEMEVPEEEAKRRGYTPIHGPPASPAPA
jgi:lysylphosphatidylglycerol synthetase-like protein (DUF2156 family)